ncbi:hypothetical protein EMCRGX_G027223 [Ephydatia muelleri]
MENCRTSTMAIFTDDAMSAARERCPPVALIERVETDWSKYQAKSIKLSMNQFSPLFTQKAEASMVASFTTPLSELVEIYGSLQLASPPQVSRSIALDAGLTCDRSLSEQQGQLTAPDAAMHSVRHLVHTSALHVNSSGCERTLEHSAHFSFCKIDRLFALAKVGLGSYNKAGGEAIF